MTPVIDIHTHTFPDRIAAAAVAKLQAASHTARYTDGTCAGLGASMRRAGVWRSVVLPVATHPEQVVHINDASIRINEETGKTGLLSFGCMHPDFEGWHAELGRLRDAGIRGIKLHPVYQGTAIDDPRTLRLLTRAGELGLAVLVHAGLDIGYPGMELVMPKQVLRAIRQAGPVRLILAHMGGWRCWEEAAELLAETGAGIDTAFSLGTLTPSGDGYPWTPEALRMLSPEDFTALVRRFGAERVYFGTDSPWADQAEALRALQALPLTEAELDRILGRNAMELLGLEEETAS